MAQTLDENSPVGTLVATISATDADLINAIDSQITYGIDTVTSVFGIDASTGKVYVASDSLDRETTASYTLTISAYSSNQTANKITGTMTITLNDLNDVTPTFSQDVYNVTLAEDSALSVAIATSATDTDLGTNGQISYSIISGNTAPGCGHTIDAAGDISLGENLDYENSTICTLIIAATDNGAPALSSTATAYIIVTPVNEYTPVFGGPYNFNVPEDATAGTTIGAVAATDFDTGKDGVIVYSLNTHADTFFVNSATGVISVLAGLDRETLASYNVEVYAIDQSTITQKTGSVTAVISVTDINDNGPLCVNVEHITLISSVSVGDTVYTANCSDPDSGINGMLTYSIVSGNINSDFSLSGTGVLTVQNPPSQVNYNIKILVSDQGTVSNTAYVYAVITVTANPVFTSFPSTLSVNETEPLGTVITTISATASSGLLTYQIVSGNSENKFEINKYIGALYLINPLDRETTASYSLVLRVTDSVSSLTQDNTTTVTVDDMNDNTPTFASSFYECSVVESVTPTVVIVNLPVTDADINQNAAITYNIESGNTAGKFAISASGDLSLIATVDTETTPMYTLIITATDNGSPTQLTGSTIVLVKVTNVNEYTPQFLPASGTYSHSLAENTSIGANIFNISAQDLDVGTQISYALTAGNTGNAFTIDSQTGSIYLIQYLDRETLDTYTLSIEADNGEGQTASGTLMITVDDINDNDPIFSPTTYTGSIIETSSVGVSVVTVTCSDVDLGVNAVFAMSITGGNTDGAFRLFGSRVEVNSTLNYDILNKYVLLVEAVDTGMPPRSSTATVIIDIMPFYAQPTFPALTPTQAISESTVLGTTIYDLDATLSGSIEGTSGDLSYTLQSGDPTGKFSVNTYTGEVTVIGSLDRETTASYSLYFVAENKNDATKRDSITLTVTLNDVNDNYPAFTSSSYIFVIDEGVALGTSVGTVSAVDPDDGGNAAVTYAIVAGESYTDFSINPTSGQITVNAALSATVRDSYVISVQASDGGVPSKTVTVDVIITVNDINDNTPTFGQTLFNLQVTESAPVGQVLYQFTANDADKGSNALITYTITGGNFGSKFTFEALTGELKLNNALDRETLTSYSLTIEARDAGIPSLVGTATVSVTVQDVNDNTPQFLNSIYPVTVPRLSATGTYLTQVFATDIDAGTNADVRYYIASGNADNLFFVNDTSGIVTTVAELTSASDTYNIICQAVDNGYPRLTSTTTVAVTVDPMFGSVTASYSFTVSETIPVNTFIGTIFQDPVHPAGATVHYTIIGGNFNNNIQISLIGGSISNANTLDRETHSDYYLTIKLQDINFSITYNKFVHIAVTDVNDVTPDFALGSGVGPYTLHVVENLPVGYSIYTVSAVDTDEGTNGQITYEIPTSNAIATSMFNINSAGVITLKTSPDYELVTRVVFEVLAKDGGSPSYTGTVTITASIVDVTDTQIPGTSAFFSFECSSDAVNDDVIATLTPSGFGLTTAATDSIQFITMNSVGVFNVKSSGDFYLQKAESVYPETRYYMWVVIRVTDSFNNVTATSGMVRVDTFIPSTHMVVLGHNVSATSIENQK
ncbi:hypothetical protein KUTeg_021053 [Tegillarca granosa]|uniref:Cadherin domain-containing protein n=1 Tax=Tegillarca granosa TaxID=220873 RepID=A0ABQ9EDZ1_TEGGR|nr:hypothetical protein KUTeg_021053 [Tegillarca granosa]